MTTRRRSETLSVVLLLTLLTLPTYAQKVPFENEDHPLPWVEKFMGRFFQSNQWSRLDELSKNALKVAVENNLDGLKTQAQWYQTLVLAQNGAKPETVLAELKKTIEYGYRSVRGIESADQLAPLRDDSTTEPQFRKLLEGLRETVAAEAKAKYEAAVNEQLEKNKALGPSSLGVHAIVKPDGKNAGEEGRPMVVVLSRTYHAGFRKQWPALESAVAPFKDRITPLALFYENGVKSELVQAQAAHFASAAGVEDGNYALIDRKTFKNLEAQFEKLHEARQQDATEKTVFNLYFPFTFIVDGSGVPLYSASGCLTEGEVAYTLGAALAGLPEPKPEEAKAEEESAETSEKAAPPPGEESPEKNDEKKVEKKDDEKPETPEETTESDSEEEKKEGEGIPHGVKPHDSGDSDSGDSDSGDSDSGDSDSGDSDSGDSDSGDSDSGDSDSGDSDSDDESSAFEEQRRF